jgi:hypothetical protein
VRMKRDRLWETQYDSDVDRCGGERDAHQVAQHCPRCLSGVVVFVYRSFKEDGRQADRH